MTTLSITYFDGSENTLLTPFLFSSETVDIRAEEADGSLALTLEVRDVATGDLKRTMVVEGTGTLEDGLPAEGSTLDFLSLYDRAGTLAATVAGFSFDAGETADILEWIDRRWYVVQGYENYIYLTDARPIRNAPFNDRETGVIEVTGTPFREVYA